MENHLIKLLINEALWVNIQEIEVSSQLWVFTICCIKEEKVNLTDLICKIQFKADVITWHHKTEELQWSYKENNANEKYVKEQLNPTETIYGRNKGAVEA